MLRSEIIEKVKARLDEYSPFSEPQSLVALGASEVKPIDSYIEQVLAGAQDAILRIVPLSRVRETVRDLTMEANGQSAFGQSPVMERMGSVGSDDYEVGTLVVPQDFLRLHTVRFDTWKRDVNRAHDISEPEYVVQRNKYTRGRNHKPSIIINNGVFEVYSLTFDADDGEEHCKVFRYIPLTDAAETTFEDSISDLVVLEAAREVANIFGEVNVAKELAEELIKLYAQRKRLPVYAAVLALLGPGAILHWLSVGLGVLLILAGFLSPWIRSWDPILRRTLCVLLAIWLIDFLWFETRAITAAIKGACGSPSHDSSYHLSCSPQYAGICSSSTSSKIMAMSAGSMGRNISRRAVYFLLRNRSSICSRYRSSL